MTPPDDHTLDPRGLEAAAIASYKDWEGPRGCWRWEKLSDDAREMWRQRACATIEAYLAASRENASPSEHAEFREGSKTKPLTLVDGHRCESFTVAHKSCAGRCKCGYEWWGATDAKTSAEAYMLHVLGAKPSEQNASVHALVAEARRLCDAATPGPWHDNSYNTAFVIVGRDHPFIPPGDEEEHRVNSGYSAEIASIPDYDCTSNTPEGIERRGKAYGESARNLAFICAARSLVPKLCDELERALQESTK